MKYVIIASAFTGNQGAASMLEASIQQLRKKDKKAQFTLLSMYPNEDKNLNSYKNVKILNAKPLQLGLVINPLTLLYKLLPPLRGVLKKHKAVQALAEADALLDQGGITFVDGRTKFLIYNVASILPGIFTNTPVIKCSQAMGPFHSLPNKLSAWLLLPKMRAIFARGEKTQQYLAALKLKNVSLAADLAFLMEVSSSAAKSAKAKLQDKGIADTNRLIGILPSEVIKKKYESEGKDYIHLNRQLIQYLLKQKFKVVLLPHSTRFNTDKTHNNDLPLCRQIAESIQDPNFFFLDQQFNAQEVRYVISQCELVVTSRFHAMVSALATSVPALIIGWSHKYQEVMDMFDLKELAIDSKKGDLKTIEKYFNRIYKDRNQIKHSIKKYQPAVNASSQSQIDILLEKIS